METDRAAGGRRGDQALCAGPRLRSSSRRMSLPGRLRFRLGCGLRLIWPDTKRRESTIRPHNAPIAMDFSSKPGVRLAAVNWLAAISINAIPAAKQRVTAINDSLESFICQCPKQNNIQIIALCYTFSSTGSHFCRSGDRLRLSEVAVLKRNSAQRSASSTQRPRVSRSRSSGVSLKTACGVPAAAQIVSKRRRSGSRNVRISLACATGGIPPMA